MPLVSTYVECMGVSALPLKLSSASRSRLEHSSVVRVWHAVATTWRTADGEKVLLPTPLKMRVKSSWRDAASNVVVDDGKGTRSDGKDEGKGRKGGHAGISGTMVTNGGDGGDDAPITTPE